MVIRRARHLQVRVTVIEKGKKKKRQAELIGLAFYFF